MTENEHHLDAKKALRNIIADSAERFQSESGVQVPPAARAFVLNAVADRADVITQHPREQVVNALLATFSEAKLRSSQTNELLAVDASPVRSGAISVDALASFEWPWPFSDK